MASNDSPTLRRWELAARLKQLRLDHGYDLERVAEHLGCSTSKVSRLENAARGATIKDVRALVELYGLNQAPEGDQLIELARRSREAAWWQRREDLNGGFSTYADLEDAASQVREFQPSLIPGLLQTPDYARALIGRVVPKASDAEVDQAAQVRQVRKELLARDPHPEITIVIDEALLRREVGGPEVMREQLLLILRGIQEGAFSLQVLPFAAGAHAGMAGGFSILGFAQKDLDDVVFIEGHMGHIFLSKPDELARFHEMFQRLQDLALTPAESGALVRREAESLGAVREP